MTDDELEAWLSAEDTHDSVNVIRHILGRAPKARSWRSDTHGQLTARIIRHAHNRRSERRTAALQRTLRRPRLRSDADR